MRAGLLIDKQRWKDPSRGQITKHKYKTLWLVLCPWRLINKKSKVKLYPRKSTKWARSSQLNCLTKAFKTAFLNNQLWKDPARRYPLAKNRSHRKNLARLNRIWLRKRERMWKKQIKPAKIMRKQSKSHLFKRQISKNEATLKLIHLLKEALFYRNNVLVLCQTSSNLLTKEKSHCNNWTHLNRIRFRKRKKMMWIEKNRPPKAKRKIANN